jgi:dienelactone hydrolase
MNKLSFVLAIAFCLAAFSCKDDESHGVHTTEEVKWININGKSDFDIPTVVVTPQGEGPYPAIVVLHGCGGLLSDANNQEMASHFQYWAEFGKENKVVMIFPNSFTPRGFSEFCGVAPPADAICSPAYERPKDVADILNWIADQNYIDVHRLGIMGFSHGGSTTIASLVNTGVIMLNERSVANEGITYEVPGPVEMPSGLTFKAGVAYYPGAGFYGYFKDEYLPYAPLLIQAASLDPLYTSGGPDALVESALANGASIATKNNVEMIVHEGASHSFDGATSGADGDANVLAKQKTIEWFKKYLKF